jgi:YVTN family beta-propeller protein
MPRAIALGLGAAWVANDDKTLSRINLRTHEVEKTIPLEATATGLAVGDAALWIAYGYLGAVSRLAPEYNSESSPVSLPINRSYHSARGSVTFADHAVWVAFGDSKIFRVDPRSMTFDGPFFAGSQPAAMTSGLGSLWIANTQDATVTRFNTGTNAATVASITVGAHPNDLTVGDDAVWVADTGENAVSRIDAATSPSTVSSVGAIIPVGRRPAGIAYAADTVWVANSGDGTISRIDPKTNKVVATIRVGNAPSAIETGGGAVWVTVQPTAGST